MMTTISKQIYDNTLKFASVIGFGVAAGVTASGLIPASIPLLAMGLIGGVPAGITAITHDGYKTSEKMGQLAEGRTKVYTAATTVGLAVVTAAALIALGVTSPVGALLIVLPTLAIGAILTFNNPMTKAPSFELFYMPQPDEVRSRAEEISY
jgi:hypothetical protein